MIWPFAKSTPRLATRLAVQTPAPSGSRAPLALVLIAKNEAARIGDWLAFHALAGASHVILYDNGSTDDSVGIARNFKGLDVTVVPWTLQATEAKSGMRLHQQVLAYAHAIGTFGGGFERMAFIDTDEFLVPREAMTLTDTFAELPHPNISLPWTMFGHGGHETRPEAAVPFAFQDRAPISEGPLLNFKCIVDPCEVTMVNPHRFETRSQADRTSSTCGVIATNKQRSGRFVCHDVIQLNHYYLMSEQEMQAKIAGTAISGADHQQRKEAILRKARLIEEQPIRDRAAAEFLARHGVMDTASLRKAF